MVQGGGSNTCTEGSNGQDSCGAMYHYACDSSGTCQKVSGYGTDSCTYTPGGGNSCYTGSGSYSHLACINNACITVNSSGANECAAAGSSCFEGSNHKECYQGTCTLLGNSGTDSCASVGTSCGTTNMGRECINGTCVSVDFVVPTGGNSCDTPGQPCSSSGNNGNNNNNSGSCGDGTCNNGETCSTCSQDCGGCNNICTNTSPGTNKMQGCLWGDKNLGSSGTGGSGAGSVNQLGNAPTESTDTSNPGTTVAINESTDPSGQNTGSNYSIRWQGTFTFPEGTYAFNAGSDDGYRLFIDGNSSYFMNDWGDPHGYRPQTANLSISGQHTLKYEYYQNEGGAKAYLAWTQVVGCGTSNGGTFVTAPSTNLCSVGTAGTVSANGSSWNWTCTGSDPSNSTDSCSAHTPAPTISLSPTAMTFNGVSGSGTPPSQLLTITNSARLPSKYDYNNDGVVNTADLNILEAVAGGSQSCPSGKTCDINGDGSVTVTDVQLFINMVSAATLNWTSGSVSGKTGTWCRNDTSSGTLYPGAVQQTSISVSSPSNVGSFTDCGIRISDPNASNNPQDLALTYVVSANPNNNATSSAPTISLSPSVMTFNGVSGGSAPAGQTLTVSDAVSGTALNWKATTDQTWCHASPLTGTAPNGSPSSVTVTMDAPSNTGTFTCNVTVSDNGSTPPAGNSPQGIVATYIVQPSDTCSGSDCGFCNSGVCGGNGGGNSSDSVAATAARCPSTGISLSWLTAQGTVPITYNIYRNTTGGVPSVGNLLSASPVSGIAYTDPVTSGGPYYYWVQSISGSQTSPDKVAANTNSSGGISPTLAYSCSGSASNGVANLLTSDKDIIAINGVGINYPNSGPQACNATTDALPSNVSLNIGDSVTFQINLCNTSASSPASQIVVTDSMTNLQQVPNSPTYWNAWYNGNALIYSSSPTASADHYYVTGTAPNQSLVFNLTGSGDNVLADGPPQSLTYQAQLITPAGATGNSSRFMNSFTAVFNPGSGPNQSVTRSTPYIPFYIGNVLPSIQEIP